MSILSATSSESTLFRGFSVISSITYGNGASITFSPGINSYGKFTEGGQELDVKVQFSLGDYSWMISNDKISAIHVFSEERLADIFLENKRNSELADIFSEEEIVLIEQINPEVFFHDIKFLYLFYFRIFLIHLLIHQ